MIYSAKVLILPQNTNFLVVSGTIYNQILIWDSSDGLILCTLVGHQGVILNIGFDLTTNYLYSVSKESLSINGKLCSKFYGHDARVWKCIWFRTNNEKLYLCSIGEDLKCCIWSLSENKLFYRFNTIRKGSKNIWSLCIDEKNLNLITGWQDGGLRKYELKWYLEATNENESCLNELKIKYDLDKDYARTVEIFDDLVICCTNNGFLYSISTNGDQKCLLRDENLASYNCMAKISGLLAIGPANGKIFLMKFLIFN